MNGGVKATVDVNRESGEIQFWGLVVIARLVREKDAPIVFRDTVTRSAAANSRKIERAVDVCGLVREIDPQSERSEAVSASELFGRIGWPNEMHVSGIDWRGDVGSRMVV